ncbi:MAG: hypothetical protein OHK0021_23720 [Bryobacter sp.]
MSLHALAGKFAKFLLLPCLALGALAAAGVLAPAYLDGALAPRLEGFRFLEGKQLERLRSGQSVAYDFSLQLTEGPRLVQRSLERFVISYDLWEENFAVVQLNTAAPNPRAAVAHLKLEAVGEWCLQRLRVPIDATNRQRELQLTLEVRSVPGKLPNPLRSQGSVDLANLVEIFSRPAAAGEYRMVTRSLPFRIGATAAEAVRP